MVPVVAAMLAVGLAGCGDPPTTPLASAVTAHAATSTPAAVALASTTAVPATLVGVQPQLATDPAQIGADLVSDERALRDPATPEDALAAAAHREQVAYRAIGRHPEWDSIIRPQIPPDLLGFTTTTSRLGVSSRRWPSRTTPCRPGVSSRRRHPTS